MRRDKLEFTTTTIEDERHPAYKQTQYQVAFQAPQPADVKGCPLGRSFASHDAAYQDLRRRVQQESDVDIGALREIDETDVVLAVAEQLGWCDDFGGTGGGYVEGNAVAALGRIRETYDLLMQRRAAEADREETRKRRTYAVWMRRKVKDYGCSRVEADSLDEAKVLALADGSVEWDLAEEGDPYVTEVRDYYDEPVTE